MLTLVDIEPIADRPNYYWVTVERDGKRRQYEYHVTLPGPDELGGIGPPDELYCDLIDYAVKTPGSISHGMLTVPAIRIINGAVARVSLGKSVELPLLLDER